MSWGFWTVWNRNADGLRAKLFRKPSVASRVHNPSHRPFSQIEFSAIAISGGDNQRHVHLDGIDLRLFRVSGIRVCEASTNPY